MTPDLVALVERLRAPKHNPAQTRYVAELIETMRDAAAALESLAKDAERYRFLRSPLAAEYGIVQKEFWEEFAFKLCREEKMDELVDGAMKLLRRHIDAATDPAAPR